MVFSFQKKQEQKKHQSKEKSILSSCFVLAHYNFDRELRKAKESMQLKMRNHFPFQNHKRLPVFGIA